MMIDAAAESRHRRSRHQSRDKPPSNFAMLADSGGNGDARRQIDGKQQAAAYGSQGKNSIVHLFLYNLQLNQLLFNIFTQKYKY